MIEKNVSNKDECFKILFLSIYKLLSEGFVILDYKSVAESIKSAKSIFDEFIANQKVDYMRAETATDNIYKIIKSTFAKAIPKTKSNLELEIDKRLSYSKIELQMTEFKLCVSNFEAKNFNENCITGIAETLVAMANTNNTKEEGLVIIGIANDKHSFDDWYKIFKSQPVIVNQHYIPGISCEAQKLFGDSDKYYRALRRILSSHPISEKLKNYILENFELIDYHDVELLVLKSKNVDEISLYNGIKYVRQSNETIKIL